MDDYCWLPEELTDQVFFLGQEEDENEEAEMREKVTGRFSSGGTASGVPLSLASSFPSEFPYDVESSLSPSPLGSAAGTDSEDEELVTGLTQKMMMTHSSLRLSEAEKPGAWPMSTGYTAEGEAHEMSAGVRRCSPQCTLSPTGSWRSPTELDYLFLAYRKREDSALDLLLSDAALQVERMRLNEGADLHRALAGEGRGLLPGPSPYRKNGSVPAEAASFHKSTAAGGFYANPAHPHQQQLQSIQLPPPQRPVPAPPGGSGGPRQNRVVAGGPLPGGTRLLGPSSPSTCSLPAHQHQPLGGSSMRAVCLVGAGTRRESSGTGVFLPRRDGNPPGSKKPACSTVLLPARVLQALNLNLNEIGALPVSHGAGFLVNRDIIRAKNLTTQTRMLQQRRIQNNAVATHATIHQYPNRRPNHLHLSKPTHAIAMTQEIRLPPDWSY